ncbi:MAG: DUF695 domain-containing protein [Verrucomicrobia bacterium]|nr:DUF695 domain-containing protein [Verrucomicrobiota bacterium]
MWPFNKNTSRPDRLPIDDSWSVGQGENNGNVMFVRYNTAYRKFGSVPDYEHQVGICVPLCSPEPTGLPSPEESEQLRVLEDTICDSLGAEAESLLVAVITTSGMREFVFYTRAPESVKLRFEALLKSITSHEIQLMIQPDADWNVYASFDSGEG